MGNAVARVMDGAFVDPIEGVVVGSRSTWKSSTRIGIVPWASQKNIIKEYTKRVKIVEDARLIDQSKLLLTETVVEENEGEMLSPEAVSDSEEVSVDDLSPGDLTGPKPEQVSSLNWWKPKWTIRPFTPDYFRGHCLFDKPSRLSRAIRCYRHCPVMWCDRVCRCGEHHRSPRQLSASAVCIRGSGDVRVAKAQI